MWRAEANSELSKGDAALAQGHFTAAINAYSAALEKGEQHFAIPLLHLHAYGDAPPSAQ